DAMLNGLCARPKTSTKIRLTTPMRGCSRNTQPIAVKKVGTSVPTAINVNTHSLPGRSVRSTSHAMGMAKNKEITTVVDANPRVLSKVLKVKESVRIVR